MRASSASPARSPARPSTTRRIASASAIATRACACTSRASSASSSRSIPPVSIRSKRTPFHSVAEPLAVAGDAGLGRGDRLGAADQPVDQGALADVGEADDGDRGAHRLRGRESSLAREADHAADDFFEREARGVELDRVLGGAQGAVLTLGVAGVAAPLGGEDRGGVLPGLGGAALRPLLVGGGEEDLQRRVGADHGADVAALGDVVTGRDQLPLAGDHRLAHRRMHGDPRGVRGHLGPADRT